MTIEEMMQALVDQVLKTPNTADQALPVNKALAKLRGRIEQKLEALVERDDIKEKWAEVILKDANEKVIAPNFQVHTCKWADVRAGRSTQLVYKKGIGKRADSAGYLEEGSLRTLYAKDDDLSRGDRIGPYAVEYFDQLFHKRGAPLKSAGDLFDSLDQHFRGRYAVTLSLDFYYTRPLNALGLHKDTTGTTLLVGLHYNNEARMVGPEYIYDLWPKFRERLYSPYTLCQGGEDNGVYYWPWELRSALELARQTLKGQQQGTEDVVHVATMEPNGLIAFVDELLFHQTPLTARRNIGKEEERDGHNTAVYNGVTIDIIKELGFQNRLRPRVRRQFSIDKMDRYWHGRATSSTGRRSFVRFWAMLEPVQWFS